MTDTPAARPSLLANAEIRRFLVVCAVCYGLATWGLEAILSHVVRDAPREPWGGVYRLVESVLWIGTAAIAIRIAERWPIESLGRQWRRVLAQVSLAVMLGPVWGTIAYGISPYLMPWWHGRGLWGVIAKEAKGAFLGYGVTAALVHVILRARAQRAREIAASEADRLAAEARLTLLKLELQPAAVLRAMHAIARTISRDVDAANEALVALADNMRRALSLTRVAFVTLHEELEAVSDAVRLRSLTLGPRMALDVFVDDEVRGALVPALLLPSVIDHLADVADRVGRPTLCVRAARRGEHLVLRLSVIAGSRRAPEETHVKASGQVPVPALEATMVRVTELYGDAAAVLDLGEGGIEVVIPWGAERQGAAGRGTSLLDGLLERVS